MIVPVRNAYSRRVAGSRLAAGARNVAKMAESSEIETSAESKRTGAQEESLLHEGSERLSSATVGENDNSSRRNTGERIANPVEQSLRLDERLRAAAEAYRYTLDKLDRDSRRIKPGEVYDAPL